MKSRDIWQLFGQEGGGDNEVAGVCDSSTPIVGHLTFISVPPPDAGEFTASHPGTVFLVPLDTRITWSDNCIPVPRPRLAFAVASQAVIGRRPAPGIASTAIIDSSAVIDPTASIGHFTLVEADVTIGPGTAIASHVRIHAGVTIGSDCSIGNHTSIGSSGFGFEVAADGQPIRLAHVGGVTLGDRVEIGTHVAIAQGTIKPTIIGSDVKIDDAVFIAHNVTIRDAAFVIAGASVCGGATIGMHAWISPESTIINKATVGDNAMVGLGAVVVSDVPENEIVAGVPARSHGQRPGRE